MKRGQVVGLALCAVLAGCDDGGEKGPRSAGDGGGSQDGGGLNGGGTAGNGGTDGSTGSTGSSCGVADAQAALTVAPPVWSADDLDACNDSCAEFNPDDPTMIEALSACLQACPGFTQFQICLVQNAQFCHANGGACEESLADNYCCQVDAFSVCAMQTTDQNAAIECALDMCESEGTTFVTCANSLAGQDCLEQAFVHCASAPGVDGGTPDGGNDSGGGDAGTDATTG